MMTITKSPINEEIPEGLEQWLFDKQVDVKLLIEAILEGQTQMFVDNVYSTNAVPTFHILKVAKKFGVEMNDEETINNEEDLLEKDKRLIITLILLLDTLTNDQRIEVFSKFCVHCGIRQPNDVMQKCQCWNDE